MQFFKESGVINLYVFFHRLPHPDSEPPKNRQTPDSTPHPCF